MEKQQTERRSWSLCKMLRQFICGLHRTETSDTLSESIWAPQNVVLSFVNPFTWCAFHQGGRTPDRAGTSRRAGEPDLHLIHMMFRLYTDWSHIASGQLQASIRLASGWDVPHAFVFLRNMGCSMYFCLYRMFHVLFFLLHMGCSMCFFFRMFHVLLFVCLTQDVPHAFVFLLNTGCSTCFWFFAKHGMFHVLLFIRDVLCAFVFLRNIGCSMCFYLYGMFHVL